MELVITENMSCLLVFPVKKTNHKRGERMRLLRKAAMLAGAATILLAGTCQGYDLPAVNLGFTSFLDGGPPAGPGFYFTEYIQFYTADQLNDADGDEIPFPDPDLDVWVSLNQGIYQSNTEILWGGKWGIDIIVPLVSLDLDYAAMGPFPQDNGAGLGDILIGPFIQWDPIIKDGRPVFMHRVEFQMLFPTGKYDDDKSLNPGSNVFSFNPYWSGTFFVTPRLTATTRIHYLWNGENDDPFGGAKDSQAGQAIHLNFASGYEIIPKTLRVGVNGYYLKQITESEVDGKEVDDSKEEVFGIGPGLLWHISPDSHLFVNAYIETHAENRPEGNRFTLRYVHHF